MKDCVLWDGAIGNHGYGCTTTGALAHRVAYAEANGLDHKTMGGVVMHSCDVRACVEPSHLTLGTHQQNTQDMLSKGRHSHGAAHRSTGDTKLNADAVRYCRENYVAHSRTYGSRALARKFGVAHPQILKAISGETWGDV